MQCLFEKIKQFHLSLENYQDSEILLSLNVIAWSNSYSLSGQSNFDMDWNLFLPNCFHNFKLLIIMFIRMFDVQCWKSNNICNTWKIKKGKTKDLNMVYFLKRINELCNFNFSCKITWPSPQQYTSPTKIKISDPPAKTFLKIFNLLRTWGGGGGGVECDVTIQEKVFLQNRGLKK